MLIDPLNDMGAIMSVGSATRVLRTRSTLVFKYGVENTIAGIVFFGSGLFLGYLVVAAWPKDAWAVIYPIAFIAGGAILGWTRLHLSICRENSTIIETDGYGFPMRTLVWPLESYQAVSLEERPSRRSKWFVVSLCSASGNFIISRSTNEHNARFTAIELADFLNLPLGEHVTRTSVLVTPRRHSHCYTSAKTPMRIEIPEKASEVLGVEILLTLLAGIVSLMLLALSNPIVACSAFLLLVSSAFYWMRALWRQPIVIEMNEGSLKLYLPKRHSRVATTAIYDLRKFRELRVETDGWLLIVADAESRRIRTALSQDELDAVREKLLANLTDGK